MNIISSEKQKTISAYFSLIKFSHTIFALPFALIGFLAALESVDRPFDWFLAGKILLCMIFARSAAMAFNRFADQKFDKENPRTAVREIPSGIISANSALLFVVLNSVLFVITTAFINNLCFALSPMALIIILGYSYTKRFTALCHFVLGLGLSLAPIGAYLSVTGEFHILPLLFSAAVLFWVSGFDIIYALQDEMFDKSHKLKSIPVVLGQKGASFISIFLHTLTVLFIVMAGFTGNFGSLYYTGTMVFTLLLIYQHSLIRNGDLSRINLAFFTTNGIASIVFAIFTVIDLFTN